jgi:hypothetical protein
MNILAAADLMSGARIQQAAASVGATVTSAPRDGDLVTMAGSVNAQVAVLDLAGVPDVGQAIRSLKSAGVAVVGYCGHTNAALIELARSAGIDEVLSHGEVGKRLPTVLRAFMTSAKV